MNHTPQIKKALQFAARKHKDQYRREAEPLPYITHPVSVALLVAEDGAEDDVVCAALLHDVLEDTDATRAELVEAFNECVASYVEDVSERPSVERGSPEASTPKGEQKFNGKSDLSWRERKEGYIAHLEVAPDEALLISIADKIDNIESKLEAIERGEGEALLAGFSQPQAEYLWYHSEVARIARERLPNHRLTERLLSAHQREQEALSAR